MSDDLDCLREKVGLSNLLAHYARFAEIDRVTWQDRLMVMDGMEPTDISKLHGELIAFGWVEQNTGGSPGLREGAVSACYRATLAGIRAIQQIQNPEQGEPEEASIPFAEAKFATKGKRKRTKGQQPEVVIAA